MTLDERQVDGEELAHAACSVQLRSIIDVHGDALETGKINEDANAADERKCRAHQRIERKIGIREPSSGPVVESNPAQHGVEDPVVWIVDELP